MAFPLGFFQATVSLLLLDVVGIGLTSETLGFSLVLLSVLWCFLGWKNHVFALFKTLRFDWKAAVKPCLNLPWILLFVLIVLLAGWNFERTLFFPFAADEFDSLAGFETLGWLISKEHTFVGLSVFSEDWNPLVHEAKSYIGYAPLCQLSYASIYLFGFETSKLCPALIFLSFLLVFYGMLKRESGSLLALLVTFLMMLTPLVLNRSVTTYTNAIHMVYATLGMIYAWQWLLSPKGSNHPAMWLSSVLLSANFLARLEGGVFSLAIGLWAGFLWLRGKKGFKEVLLWAIPLAVVLFGWVLFREIGNLRTDSFMISHLFWDAGKVRDILGGLHRVFSDPFNFGWTVWMLVMALVFTVLGLLKKKCSFVPLLTLGGSFLLYALILYQMDYTIWDPLDAVLAYSASRFLLCYVPLVWYCFVSAYPVKYGFGKVEKCLAWKK